jgi:predicted small lipoprotein YifL
MIEKIWRLALAITVILAFVFAFSGCGLKGDPIPPKETLPKAISDCRAAA